MLTYAICGVFMEETEEMLEQLEMEDIDDLFEDIPSEVRKNLDLPEGLSEMEVIGRVTDILGKNKPLSDHSSFIGGGIYKHFIPSSVFEMIGRSEFYTSYTPYQAEISQGILQALFEYQSLICELTGMDAANCSMYDYHTASAEALMMAARIGKRKRKKILVPKNIHWEKPEVFNNYLRGMDFHVDYVNFDKDTGEIDKEDLKSKMSDEILALYVETPNVFGILESDLDYFKDMKEDHKTVLIAGTNPLVLSLMRPPSGWGADIVVGDSQPFGIPPSFGGPTVGIFATRRKHIRKMPGRVIGETVDADENTAYCMTLQTREQHIRRERATSNICTNQALMALASAVHLFLKGGKGLESVAKRCYENAHALKEKIDSLDGYNAPRFSGEFFNEFAFDVDNMDAFMERASKVELIPGVDISGKYDGMDSALLTAATEINGEEDIDKFIQVLQEVKG